MFPYGFNWNVIKLKEGDDVVIALSPIERSSLIVLIINLKAIAENGGVPQMTDDKDAFDAMCDGMLQKFLL